jgi:hypothetical protein
MGTGQEFVKKLRPAGCALVVILTVIVTILMFTSKGIAVDGYDAPHDSDYYAEHIDELKTEIEENMLPKLEGVTASLSVEDGKVQVTAESVSLQKVKNAVNYYYGLELFTFEEQEEE